MNSTTASKKNIVDFLWEWAEKHDDWGKYLVELIVKGEAALNSVERQLIFDYFIDSFRKNKILPKLVLTKPNYKPTSKLIKLKSLSDVTGVNKLAKNQKFSFGKNLTIIYGENGTGKTGYGRILKSLGFSYDVKTQIYSNIHAAPEPKSAVVEYEINGTDDMINWDGHNFSEDLSNISVFNNQCVQISLSDRKLIVSPSGFHLFELISFELNELSSQLNQKINSYTTTFTWTERLNEGTPQHQFITTLAYTSKESDLNTLSITNENTNEKLATTESKLQGLNQQLIRTEIQNIKLQTSELKAIKEKVIYAQNLLSETQQIQFIHINSQIKTLKNKTQSTIKEVADRNGIKFYDSSEYKSFITSAEAYINKLQLATYPTEDDKCVYCNQELSVDAINLLKSYRALLNDTTEKDLKNVQKEKDIYIENLKKIDTNIKFIQPTYGMDEKELPRQPDTIKNYNETISSVTKRCFEDTLDEKFDYNFTACVEFLDNEITKLDKDVSEKQILLDDIVKVESSLRAQINELKDRILLAEKQKEVCEVIKAMQAVSFLHSKSSSFNTASISRKTSEAREALIRQNFHDIFQNELATLRKSHIQIDLNFGTDRGSSKVSQNIKAHNLVDILSEGEQKAIALAEFLTELQLDTTKAPVIFDDPVNSLDHVIIDEVAKRLFELSKSRQVIIFTHSILFLNSIIQQSKLKIHSDLDAIFYSVKNNFGLSGIIDDVEQVNSYTYYTNKLQEILRQKSGDSEAKLAAEGYGHLRSAIEVCVEETILKNIIVRYGKGVSFPAILRINGEKLDAYKAKLNDIYEKCCTSIDGHSSPKTIHVTPELAVLEADFTNFKNIRREFLS